MIPSKDRAKLIFLGQRWKIKCCVPKP
jgi:hypothetical protein